MNWDIIGLNSWHLMFEYGSPSVIGPTILRTPGRDIRVLSGWPGEAIASARDRQIARPSDLTMTTSRDWRRYRARAFLHPAGGPVAVRSILEQPRLTEPRQAAREAKWRRVGETDVSAAPACLGWHRPPYINVIRVAMPRFRLHNRQWWSPRPHRNRPRPEKFG